MYCKPCVLWQSKEVHWPSAAFVCCCQVSGGAYGGFCDFDTHTGMFTYSSYRDPNLLKTVDAYDGAEIACCVVSQLGNGLCTKCHCVLSLALTQSPELC